MSAAIGVLNGWGALGLLAVGALIVLHLYDRRRRVVPVSTLFLWRQLPAAPLERRRRLRPDRLLLLRIAALLLLVASLVRPWIGGPAVEAPVVARVVVLDVSASMQTRERDGTRFELARRRAAELLDAGGETMLVAAAIRPRVLVRWTADTALVRRRLETVEPLDTGARLDAAVALAVAEARLRPGASVTVLTDEPRAASPLDAEDLAAVDWVQLGRTDDNVGIAGLVVSAPPFRPVSEATATVDVRNWSHEPRPAHLEVRVNGVRWAERSLELEARGATAIRLERPPTAGVVTATLDGTDAFAADDVAHAWLPAARPLDVLVVSDGGRLPRVLSALVRGVPAARVTSITSAAYAESPPAGTRVVVFDGVAPDPPEAASSLYVAPPPGNPRCPVVARVRDAAVVDWEESHPILAGMGSLAALAVGGASALREVPWGTSVAYAASEERAFPFLVAGEPDGRRTACLAAGPSSDTASTDELPLVLLTLATLHWLDDGGDATPLVVRTGEVVPSPVAADAAPAASGLRIAGSPASLVAERVGVFHIGANAAERLVLANLFDAHESDVGRDDGGEWPATVTIATHDGVRGVREVGRWLAAGGAVLLALEWLLWLAEVA